MVEIWSAANEPGGLLAALMPADVLVQPEVAVTRGISWLLGLEGAVGALDPLVRRDSPLVPGADPVWLTEVVGSDGGRTDLELHWGNPQRAQVIVEAKLGALLTVDQVASYRHRMLADRGLLVVLLPEGRRPDGVAVLDEYRRANPEDPISLAVWAYDEVAEALDAALPGSGDVAQLKGLLRHLRALDIAPFAKTQLWDNNDVRADDIWRVVDAASRGLFGRVLPASRSDASFSVRRFVEIRPHSAYFERLWTDTHGVWVPVDVPVGVWGATMVKSARAQMESIAVTARAAIEEAIRTELATAPEAVREVLPAVLGMASIDPADLLDSNDGRVQDIELLLTQVARSFSTPRLLPKVVIDPSFRWVRYLQVKPLGAFVATAFGPKATEGRAGPLPWAWLRVHRETGYADIGREVLERHAPGQVVADAKGWSRPLTFPPAASGPQLVVVLHEQIRMHMTAVLAAVVERHTGQADPGA